MQIERFSRRVRIVRAWNRAILGATLAAGAAVLWAFLDWAGWFYAEWPELTILMAAGAVFGAVSGLTSPVKPKSLADSIDRRANLQNRLGSATEIQDGEFAEALRHDADARLATIKPSTVYPIHVGRKEFAAVAVGALACSIFLLGNTPMFLGDKAKQDRSDIRAEAKVVERVAKENLETPEAQQEMSTSERQLANEMERLRRDMDKARLSKSDLQARENALARKADELMHSQADRAQQSLATARTALERMARAELDRHGMSNVSLDQVQMSDSEREAAKRENQGKQADLRKQLSDVEKVLAEIRKKLERTDLSEAERKALQAERKQLEAEKKALEDQLKAAEEDAKALELSEQARMAFQKLTQDPLYKQLMELQSKMAKQISEMQQGQRPALTRAEREELRRELEALAKQLNTDQARKDYLEALMEAMKQASAMGRSLGVCNGLNAGIPIWGNGVPGNDQDRMPYDLGRINKTDQPVPGQGKTNLTQVTGQHGPGTGPEQYVEIKAPSLVGNRSGVPYVNVLPSYSRKAEEALDHQQIPKEQEKRVREYFESLNGK